MDRKPSSSPRSLLVHPYIWSAQHLAILHCTFVDVDVTCQIFAPVPLPTGEYGLPQGHLFMDGPRWVITAGNDFDEFLGEILDFTGLSFCTKENVTLSFKFGHFHRINLKDGYTFKIRFTQSVSSTTPPQPGTLAPVTLITTMWQGDISIGRVGYLEEKSPWRSLEYITLDKIVERLEPKPGQHDPYIVSLLLGLAQYTHKLWPKKNRPRGNRLVHVLMGDRHDRKNPCLRISSTAVSCTYFAALFYPEKRFRRPLPALVIRCATLSTEPHDTFQDRLRQAIVAENDAIAAGELADGDKQSDAKLSGEPV